MPEYIEATCSRKLLNMSVFSCRIHRYVFPWPGSSEGDQPGLTFECIRTGHHPGGEGLLSVRRIVTSDLAL